MARAWAVRGSALALALAVGTTTGCGPGGAADAGERPDIVFVDVVQYDRPRPMDSGASDAGDVATSVDVRPFDGGSDVGADVAAVLDAPASDGFGDAQAAQCATLAGEYGRLVVQAEACGATSDCASVVCETLCCYCQVYVNPNSSAYPMLARLSSQWQALHCAEAGQCPAATACDPPASAACSSRNRCATVRAPAG